MAQIPGDKEGVLEVKTLVIIATDSAKTLSLRWRIMMRIVVEKVGNKETIGYAYEGKA